MPERSADETLARSYCKAMGIDPDRVGLIPCPDGEAGCCVAHHGPQWQAILPMAKRALREAEWAMEVLRDRPDPLVIWGGRG